MDNFINGRKKEIEVLKYVLQEEENNSDEEFNHIDQIADQRNNPGKNQKLERQLIDKIKKAKRNQTSAQNSQKLEKILDVKTIDEVLARSRENYFLLN